MESKVKFIHAADSHLGHRQYNNARRFMDFSRAFRELLDKTKKEKADFLLISGDFFHTGNVNPETMLVVYKYLYDFKEDTDGKVPVIVIEGNHDLRRYGMYRSWLQFIARTGLITLLDAHRSDNDRPVEFKEYDNATGTGGYVNIKGINIYGIRWQGSATETLIKDIAAAIDNDSFNILMMHFGVSGYLKDRKGIDYDTRTFGSLADKVQYLALGHFHKNYKIRNDNGDYWIYNPGSLEANNVAESHYERGIYIVSVNPDSKEFECKFNEDIPNRVFLDRTFNIGKGSLSSFTDAIDFILDDLEDDKLLSSSKGLPVSNLNVPVLRIVLEGSITYPRQEMDIGLLKERLEEKFNTLLVRITNDCVSQQDGYFIEKGDLVHLDKIEHHVFRSMAEIDPRYQDVAESVSSLMRDIKRDFIEMSASATDIRDMISDWWDENENSIHLKAEESKQSESEETSNSKQIKEPKKVENSKSDELTKKKSAEAKTLDDFSS